MNIVIIGTGYVGLVTGVGLASLGNNVTFIDLDEDRVTRFVPTVSTIIQLNGSSDYVVSKVYIVGNSGSVHGERQYTNFSGFKLIT